MATLQIIAAPGVGLNGYRLAVDDSPDIDMSTNTGTVVVDGTCGDGSPHTLYYHMLGNPGATLGVKIVCEDGTTKLDIPLQVYPPGPNMNGDVEFVL